MNTPRKAVTVFEEFDAVTYLKPCSEEYLKYLIVVFEDAHGEFHSELAPIENIKKKYLGSEEEFQEMLNQLGV